MRVYEDEETVKRGWHEEFLEDGKPQVLTRQKRKPEFTEEEMKHEKA